MFTQPPAGNRRCPGDGAVGDDGVRLFAEAFERMITDIDAKRVE